MKRIAFTPAAEADLEAIWDYSAVHWGIAQADRYTDEIRDACVALANGVKRGRAVDVREGYRKFATGSHMIYFVEHEDMLAVIRILHGMQDVERHL